MATLTLPFHDLLETVFEGMLAYEHSPDTDPDRATDDDQEPEQNLLPRCHLAQVDSIEAGLCHSRNNKKEAVHVGNAEPGVR